MPMSRALAARSRARESSLTTYTRAFMAQPRSPHLRALSVAAFLVASALGAASIRTPSAAAGWWDDLDKGEPARLADLIAEPRRWKDKIVTFACIFHAPDSVFSPYFTSFSADKHVNFTAWTDGSPSW